MLWIDGHWHLKYGQSNMAKKSVDTAENFQLTDDEKAAILAARQRTTPETPKFGVDDLAKALAAAIESTRPPQKKTPFNRPKPWEEKKPKFKRTWYQHGMEITPRQVSAEAIELMNIAKPGIYVKGLVRIIKMKDRSYNITWPVATSAQRLRVIQEAGATFEDILKRCIAEKADPKQFRGPDDDDDDE